MRLASALAVLSGAAIVAAWWWLGAPVAMPPSPLGPGEKLYCVSYSPFRGRDTPLDLSTRVDPQQIDEDFGRLAKLADCVRSYATDLGLDRIAEIAERHGLKVMQGIWLGRDGVRNAREVDTAIALARRFPQVIRSLVVGNEVLLRGEMSPGDLANIIRGIKAQVTVPVTYADVWEFWLRYREVYESVDFVTIHILPYWEDFPIPAGLAAAHVADIRRRVAESFPGKEVLIGEVGWPSAGRMREGALPSPATQARVIHDVLAAGKRENFRVNVIEAFDQPWKGRLEGAVGGHWGFLDGATREPKFAWGMPVSDHPHWPLQAAAGVALVALVFGAALAARRREWGTNDPMVSTSLGVAVIALIPGVLIGWALENVPIESLGIGGWTRSVVMAGLAIAAPVAGAAALVRKIATPSFAQMLGRSQERPRDPLALALGLLLVALTVIAVQVALGLVFDPRYRDLPFAPLTAALVPFLVLASLDARPDGRRGVAETVMATTLAGCAIYIALNENVDTVIGSFKSWQALWLSAALVALAVTLFRSRDAQSSG